MRRETRQTIDERQWPQRQQQQQRQRRQNGPPDIAGFVSLLA
jgi:hypothetical protein